MSIGIGGAQGTAQGFGLGGPKATGQASGFDALIEQLLKEATKTPMARAREAVLKRNDLTEEDYARLAPEKRAAIDREIADAVRKVAEQQMQAKKDGSAGLARL